MSHEVEKILFVNSVIFTLLHRQLYIYYIIFYDIISLICLKNASIMSTIDGSQQFSWHDHVQIGTIRRMPSILLKR